MTSIRPGFGMNVPRGISANVPRIATGTMGALAMSAILKAPGPIACI
jgi:hypothetical protein